MRFQTIVAPTITELFERQIQGMILSGQVEPGEKLPTEAELAENMHISKSAVHAGIKNLERMGFLRVSPRHGVYVADWAECGNVDTLISILKYRDGKLDKATTASLLQTRNVIEGLAVRLFVPKRTDDDIAVLRTIIRDFRRAAQQPRVDVDKLAELACSFHRYICFKSGNNVVPLICLAVVAALIAALVALHERRAKHKGSSEGEEAGEEDSEEEEGPQEE